MKIVAIYILFFLSFFSACSKIDNYSGPNATIQGSVIDNMTNKPIQTESPNGFFIRLEENHSNSTPLNFSGKANGTFENAAVFAGSYKVVPITGAFFTPDTAIVNISGVTNVDFTVTPYLGVAATVTAMAGGVEVKYNISRTIASGKIMQSKSVAFLSPTVSSTVFNQAVTNDLSGIADEDILSTEFTDTITGLEPGKTYYIRVAAKTNNSNNKYNYSDIIPISVP
jgi:hypothetical protein